MNKSLKIGYFADGPWSHHTFEKIISDPSLEIKFIVPREDSKDSTLYNYSVKHSIPYLKANNVNSDEFYQLVKPFNCDLFVSMSYNQIFKNRIIQLPKYKIINCHAGKLPYYRGRNILNWALINDEKEFGITVHFVDHGIDTGDIILQQSFQITDNDNYKTLLDVAYEQCANILYDSIKLIQNEKAAPFSQSSIHPVGFVCGIRGEGDEIIDWNQTSRDLFNFIRAICNPGPMATTFLNGVAIKINRARIIDGVPNYKGINGQILGKTNDGYIVKTLDSFIEILEINTISKLRIGNKLGI